MPIKVSCSCGAAFAAKDELAGRTVKCPKCQQPLAIPGGPSAPAQRQAPAQRSAPAAPQPAPADPGIPSIFDEAGMKAKQHTGQVCPSCYHSMNPGTILCIHCGYSLQLGRKMEMQVFGKEGGHGELAAAALQRAANRIEEDKQEEKKKTREGVPWWGYLIMFCAAVGLLTMMMLLKPATATVIALMFLWGIAFLLGLYGAIAILIIAFRDSVAQGLCCLLIPCYAFVYTIMHWDECGSFFLLQLLAGFVQGGAQVGLAFAMNAEGDGAEAQLPQRPPLVRYVSNPSLA